MSSRGVAGAQVACVLILGLAIVVGHYLAAPATPILEPDSGSYLAFASYRPAGYPLLLGLMGEQGALVVQPVLAALALTFLGWQLLALTRSALMGCATMLAIALNPFLLVYHYKIMSDSFYASLLMVLLGLVVHLVRKPSLGVLATASLVAGAMVAVRSAGLFVVPFMALAALMLHSRIHSRAAMLAAAIGPMLILAVSEPAIRNVSHRGEVVSVLGVTLYGKAGLIEAPATDDQSPLAVALERTYAPIRELIAASPTAPIARYLTVNYEVCIEYSCSNLLGIDTASPAALQAARKRIESNPLGYLRLSWRHYEALWLPYGPTMPGEFQAANDFLDAHRPLPFEEQAPVFTQSLKPARLALFAEPAMYFAALMTALLAVAGLAAAMLRRVLPPVLTVATMAALAVQGAAILNALGGVGIPRYTLAMWPAIIVALTCWSWSVLTWVGATQMFPDAPRARGRARKAAKKASQKVASRAVPSPAELPDLVDPAQLKPKPAKPVRPPAAKPASEPFMPLVPTAAKDLEPTKEERPAADELVAVKAPVQKVELVGTTEPAPKKKAQPVKEAEPELETERAEEKEPAEAK
jgi:hypothetical protein